MANTAYDSLLDSLGKSARAAFPFLRSLAATSAPKAAIYEFLRSNNVAIRTQTASDLIDLLRNKADVGQFIRTYGENTPLAGVMHRVSPFRLSEGSKYQYEVGTNSENPLTPEAIFMNSDRPLSANEIYARAVTSFRYEEGGGMGPSDLNTVTFSIDDARYNPGQQLTDTALPPPDYEIGSPS